jgi:hypothetical protein
LSRYFIVFNKLQGNNDASSHHYEHVPKARIDITIDLYEFTKIYRYPTNSTWVRNRSEPAPKLGIDQVPMALALERLKRILSPFPDIIRGMAEGIQQVSADAITSIQPRDPTELDKDVLYTHFENEEDCKWYEMTKKSRSSYQDCKGEVDEVLWIAAIKYHTCQKAVYCIIDKVSEVLQGESAFII